MAHYPETSTLLTALLRRFWLRVTSVLSCKFVAKLM